MLYVTQNFYKPSLFTKITTKIKLIWSLKNVNIFSNLIQFNYINYLNSYGTLKSFTNYPLIIKILFDNLHYVFLKKNLKLPNLFWKTTLEKSLKHKVFHNLLLKKLPSNSTIQPKEVLLYNQYFLSQVVSNISLHNKLYRSTLLTFLFLLVNTWPNLNKHFNLALKFSLLSNNFLLLRYYNTRIFKAYNL